MSVMCTGACKSKRKLVVKNKREIVRNEKKRMKLLFVSENKNKTRMMLLSLALNNLSCKLPS